MESRGELGRRGERLVARWLRRRRYRVLHRNLRVGRYEADLILLAPDGTIVVAEVKTRTSGLTAPEMAVNPRKQRHLVAIALELGRRVPYVDAMFRFDVIAVVWPPGGGPTIRHFESAFEYGS